MANTTFSQAAINAEQQTEAELIYQRIRGAFDDVHALGAQVLEAAADERIKKGDYHGASCVGPARTSLHVEVPHEGRARCDGRGAFGTYNR